MGCEPIGRHCTTMYIKTSSGIVGGGAYAVYVDDRNCECDGCQSVGCLRTLHVCPIFMCVLCFVFY